MAIRVELSIIPGPQDTYNVPDDANVEKLLDIAGILDDEEINMDEQLITVNGDEASMSTRLNQGDSVELAENTKGN